MKHILGFLNTQPLWKNQQFGLRQFEMPPMDISSFVPQPIPTNLRLGHQVEYIFKQLLEHSKAYHVVAYNIQVKKDAHTIGELDFIVEDIRFRESVPTQKALLHIELTYKFYIIDPLISEPIHRLMGPNRRDMFFTKLEKTRNQQLPLAFSKYGKITLEKLGLVPTELDQQTYFLGQLFVPYRGKPPSIRPLNLECIVGYWLRFDQFDSSDFREHVYYIPKKYEWLHKPHLDCYWRNHKDILMDINLRHISERAPMVWLRKKDHTLQKCFVVWW